MSRSASTRAAARWQLPDMTDEIDAWRIWMEAQGLSTRTINERITTVTALLRMTASAPATVTPEHIVAFLSRDLAAASRASYHASIRAFTRWMHHTGRRDDDPADKTPRPKRPKALPRPLAPELITALLRRARMKRTRAYILLAAFAGLRVHEIAKIHGHDIDPYSQSLIVKGKGGKVASLPMHETLITLAKQMPADDWWFPSPNRPGPVGPHAVSKAIRHTMLAVGVDAKPHQLRHSYGTELVRANVHMRVVQQLMRHESPATTAIYADVDDQQMRAGVSTLRLAA